MSTPDSPRKPRFVKSERVDNLPAVISPDPTGHDAKAGRQPEPTTPREPIPADVLGRVTIWLTVLGLVAAVIIALVEQTPVPMSVWSGACIAVALWTGYRGLLLPGPALMLAVAAGMSLACWLGGPWWLVLAGFVTVLAAWIVQTVLEAHADN